MVPSSRESGTAHDLVRRRVEDALQLGAGAFGADESENDRAAPLAMNHTVDGAQRALRGCRYP